MSIGTLTNGILCRIFVRGSLVVDSFVVWEQKAYMGNKRINSILRGVRQLADSLVLEEKPANVHSDIVELYRFTVAHPGFW